MRLNIGQDNNTNRIDINAMPPTSTARVDIGAGSNNNRLDVGTDSNNNRLDITGNTNNVTRPTIATITTSVTETNMLRIVGDQLTLLIRNNAADIQSIYDDLNFGKIDFGSIENEIPLEEKFYVTDVDTQESISDRKLNPNKYTDTQISKYDYFILNDRYLVINGFIFNAITQEYQGQFLSELGQIHTGIFNVDDLTRVVFRLTQAEFFNQKQIAYNAVEQDVEEQWQAEYERNLRVAVDQQNAVSAQPVDYAAIERAILKDLLQSQQLDSEIQDSSTRPVFVKLNAEATNVIKFDAFRTPEVRRNPAGTIVSETDNSNINVFVELKKSVYYQEDDIVDISITELLTTTDIGPDPEDLQARIDELERLLRDATLSNQDKDKLIAELQKLLNARTESSESTGRLGIGVNANENRLEVLPETNTNRLNVT
jgi:hypothetical protein